MRDVIGLICLPAWIGSLFVGLAVIPNHHGFIAVPIILFLLLAAAIVRPNDPTHEPIPSRYRRLT